MRLQEVVAGAIVVGLVAVALVGLVVLAVNHGRRSGTRS